MKNDHSENDIMNVPDQNMSRLFAIAKSAGLNDAEKSEGAVRIRAAIAASPVQPRKRSMTFGEFLIAHKARSAFALLVALIVFGGSVVERASRTLPGDALYPIKINFNEKIQSLVAVSVNGFADAGARILPTKRCRHPYAPECILIEKAARRIASDRTRLLKASRGVSLGKCDSAARAGPARRVIEAAFFWQLGGEGRRGERNHD